MLDTVEVSNVVIKKTHSTKAKIIEAYKNAEKGYDGSFNYKNYLLGLRRDCINNTIIYLGKV